MKKVLIMEDEVNIRSFVVINLKRAGYDAIEAATGQEALDRIAEHPDIGVAILDIMVPEIDGFEVCRRIRATNKKMGKTCVGGIYRFCWWKREPMSVPASPGPTPPSSMPVMI